MDQYIKNISVIVLVIIATLLFFEFYAGVAFGIPHISILAAGGYAIFQNIMVLRNVKAVYEGSTNRLNNMHWFN